MLIATGYSWQKYLLAYAYGFQAIDPAMHLNPDFEVRAAFPELQAAYPVLVGLALFLPQAVCESFVTGRLADK